MKPSTKYDVYFSTEGDAEISPILMLNRRIDQPYCLTSYLNF